MTIAAVAETPQKHALVIGLGKQLDSSWSTIHGDRDVEIVTQMLRSNGYTDITTLTNEKATKAAIVNAIKSLTSRIGTGDAVYIHFSGHGQRMTDVDGDERDDAYDEAWIPYDAYRRYCAADRGEKHLSDDELSSLLSALRDKAGRQSTIVVVVDACHSGDSTRGEEDTLCVRGVNDNFIIPDVTRGTAEPNVERWLTLSACKSYQRNYEHPNGYGKLTYAVYSMQDDISNMANDGVEQLITRYMQRADVSPVGVQTPVLTGEKERYSFGDALK